MMGAVKTLTSLLLCLCVLSGCVAGSTISHDDSAASVNHDSGPLLCKDGSTPPCNPRD
jgi:hypothetical protein